MSSPAGPSRAGGGLGPRHRRPPQVDRHVEEEEEEEEERLMTHFNHPVRSSASIRQKSLTSWPEKQKSSRTVPREGTC